MPRPIITNNPNLKLNTDTGKQQTNRLTGGIASDRELLQRRSAKYLKKMAQMDHGHMQGTQGYAELIAGIQEEFGNLGIGEYPLGVVSKCFLGAPYEVHTLDLSSARVSTDPNAQFEGGGLDIDPSQGVVLVDIISHYKKGESLPGQMEKARALAMHNSYALIEVYNNKMILIREDGSTSKL